MTTWRRWTVAAVAVLMVLWAAPAFAQRRPVQKPPVRRTTVPAPRPVRPPPHRVEASIGGLWLGGAPLGSAKAELRANRMPVAPFSLFSTASQATAAPGFDARVGFWLTRWLAVESSVVLAHPDIQTDISADAESAPGLTVNERIDQYFVDASAMVLLDALRIGTRTVPFVSGGGGYLRQLHQGQTLIETGQVYHLGGGIRHWLRVRDRGFLRGAGLRVDGRLYVLVKGIDLEDRPRSHGAISGSLFLTF